MYPLYGEGTYRPHTGVFCTHLVLVAHLLELEGLEVVCLQLDLVRFGVLLLLRQRLLDRPVSRISDLALEFDASARGVTSVS